MLGIRNIKKNKLLITLSLYNIKYNLLISLLFTRASISLFKPLNKAIEKQKDKTSIFILSCFLSSLKKAILEYSVV